jgi:CubicO group peptidase (beta-lactamase class C family)
VRPRHSLSDFLAELARAIPNDEAFALATSYEANALAIELARHSALTSIALSAPALTVDVATAQEARARIESLLVSLAATLAADAAGWVRWVFLMIQHQIRLADRLPRVWSPSTDRPITLFVHHLIDAEHWLDSRPLYSLGLGPAI